MKYSARGITFNAAAFYTDISNLQVTLDAGSCSSRIVFNVPKAHTMGVEAELRRRPVAGPRSVDRRQHGRGRVRLRPCRADCAASSSPASATATACRPCPSSRSRRRATYGHARFSDNADWYVDASFQHVGSRYTQPSDQEDAGRSARLCLRPDARRVRSGRARLRLDLKLPAYDLVNLSAGIEWDSGLERRGLRQQPVRQNAKLSFDRERGGRARLGYNVGTPRTIGLTLRYKLRGSCAASAAAAAPAATAAAASGDADLRGRVGDPGDGGVPGPAASAASAASGSGTRLIGRE